MSEKILIVDDEQEIADLVALYLENENFQVFKFYSAKDALRCIDNETLDMAILDVMLPDMNGFEICRKIREKYNYPVIMLTAKGEEVDKVTGLTLGADDYITKPFLPLELVARVKAQLRRYKRYNTGKEETSDVLLHSGLVINVKNHECTMRNGIQKYMSRDMDVSDVFPEKYLEVSVQIAEIKNRMQRNEQALKDEAQRKNDLITYLAHDLKTPLTSVIGYLSLLDEAPDMPAEQKAKYVHITLEKALRLEKLINEFFEITRYNLQQMVLEKETIDLSYMLVQMTDEFYPLLVANDNRIELHVDEQLSVYGDSEKLARLFNNILKNAIAYSYPGTEIDVTAQEVHEQVVIAVRNHGKTIPAHKLETIFEKFFRLDEARRSNTGGAGLGLAIAKEIADLHGGTITAESDREVTTFRVTLPA